MFELNKNMNVDGTTGLPLGGFGTGGVKFCAINGTFAATTQAPADQNDYKVIKNARFQFTASQNGVVEKVDRLTAVFDGERYADDAIFPIHMVDFGIINGINIKMTAFSPLDNQDYDLMSLPYAFYEFTLTNNLNSLAEAECILNIENSEENSSEKWFVLANENKVTLTSKESKSIRFVLAWYNNADPERHYYQSLYHNSSCLPQIAALGMKNFEKLKTNAKTLVSNMRASNLPNWLKNQTLNTLVNITNNSIYKKDGRVAFAEGQWTCFGTMDQMWHARSIICQLIPFYAWQELKYWAKTQMKNEDVEGQIHHDFNDMRKGADKSALKGWNDSEAADYRNIIKWVDLNCGFIISVYEAYIYTGNENELKSLWPNLKKAAKRILKQVALYGNEEYPYTFDRSENSYDAGGDPNPFNAQLSAVAYKIMEILSEKFNDKALTDKFNTAFKTVTHSFKKRYIDNPFQPQRGCEAYFSGQWLAMHLRLGQMWSKEDTNKVLDIINERYHPYYWGMGTLTGTYNEWTPYTLAHYGGLLLHTGRHMIWQKMQYDAYNRHYMNRNLVFNHELGILPAVQTHNYSATNISGDKMYISMPVLWRNYHDITGFFQNSSTNEIWLQPIILDEMNNTMNNAMFIYQGNYGTISCTETKTNSHLNRQITLKTDNPMEISKIRLKDDFDADVSVKLNGINCAVTRTGQGYTKELVIEWNSILGTNGIYIEAAGSFTPHQPALPKRPSGSPDRPTTITINPCLYVDATSYSEKAGVAEYTEIGKDWYVTGLQDDNYILFENMDFGINGSVLFTAKIASNSEGSQIEIVLDGVGGPIIGTLNVPKTNSATAWQNITIPVEKAAGQHSLALRFKNISEGCYVNLHTFRFIVDDGRLDRSLWSATFSAGTNGALAFDDDHETRWTTGVPQTPNMYFLLDLGKIQTFNTITLDTTKSRNDYPRGYKIHVSENGKDYGISIASGIGETVTNVTFPPQTARYIKITQTGTDERFFWSIYEINVFYR